MTIKQQALPMPAPKPAPVRECSECGKVFTPEDSHTELCSQQCAESWWGLEWIDFMEVAA
jgi:hypothetical protein